MPTQPRKNTPPAIELPPRPPSKVEAGLAAATSEPEQVAEPTADELRAKAIDAMVAAGLSREFAEASFVLAEDDPSASPADVHDAVGEAEVAAQDFGAPLCPHGCHGPSWADIPAGHDAVGCEHGSFARKPTSAK